MSKTADFRTPPWHDPVCRVFLVCFWCVFTAGPVRFLGTKVTILHFWVPVFGPLFRPFLDNLQRSPA